MCVSLSSEIPRTDRESVSTGSTSGIICSSPICLTVSSATRQWWLGGLPSPTGPPSLFVSVRVIFQYISLPLPGRPVCRRDSVCPLRPGSLSVSPMPRQFVCLPPPSTESVYLFGTCQPVYPLRDVSVCLPPPCRVSLPPPSPVPRLSAPYDLPPCPSPPSPHCGVSPVTHQSVCPLRVRCLVGLPTFESSTPSVCPL